MIDRYHEQAKARGVRLIPICGYEALPFDIGALLAVRKIQQEFGEDCTEIEAIANFITEDPKIWQGQNVTAGTATSALVLLEESDSRALKDPYYLDPKLRPEDIIEKEEGYNLNAYFSAEREAWMTTMFPGHIQNPPTIHRSNALFAEQGRAYGSGFRYREGLDASGFAPNAFGQKIAAKVVSYIPNNMIKAIENEKGIRKRITRFIMKRVTPASGDGPEEDMLDKFHYRIELKARSVSGKQVEYLIHGRGNPGYRSTCNIVAAAALALNNERERLPKIFGLITPATGLGLTALEYLENAGVKYELVSVSGKKITAVSTATGDCSTTNA